jgi:hypothetical protein
VRAAEPPPDLWDAYDGGSAATAARSHYGSSAARSAAARRTAASRREPPRTVVRVGDGFDVGGRVRHPRFGPGRILDREGSGKHLKLTIDFVGAGPKKILPAYTQLEVEG